jgi:hypothetical protein
VVVRHAYLAPLLADTWGVWGSTAIKLKICLATIGVFVRQEQSPRTPGRVLGPLKAAKPGGVLWVVTGHACLAPLLADAGGVWGAAATKLRFFVAKIGVFLRAEPTPLAPGHVTAPLHAAKPGGGLWVDAGHACLAPLLADTGGVWGAAATKLRFFWPQLGCSCARNQRRLYPGVHFSAPKRC